MFKYKHLREEDYWLYPVGTFTIVAGIIFLYAGVLLIRVPALILFIFGLWFSFSKIRDGYTLNRARASLVVQLLICGLLTYFLYVLTN